MRDEALIMCSRLGSSYDGSASNLKLVRAQRLETALYANRWHQQLNVGYVEEGNEGLVT